MAKRFSIDYLIGDTINRDSDRYSPKIDSQHISSIAHDFDFTCDAKKIRVDHHHRHHQITTGSSICTSRQDDIELIKYHIGLRNAHIRLEGSTLWNKFHYYGTEMIVTKTGRRMFPALQVTVSGLDPSLRYSIMVDLSCIDNKRYRYAFHQSKWIVAGPGEAELPCRVHVHCESPALGSHWMRQTVSFDKIKLTNNQLDQNGHIIVNSMHRYQPNIHIVVHSEGTGIKCRTFTFSNTSFMAVTAYQNHRITELKIESNPFAKGFRECEMNETFPLLVNSFFPFYTSVFNSQLHALVRK